MHKYGREFSTAVMENRDGIVTERVSPGHISPSLPALVVATPWCLDDNAYYNSFCLIKGIKKVNYSHTLSRIGRCIPNRDS